MGLYTEICCYWTSERPSMVCNGPRSSLTDNGFILWSSWNFPFSLVIYTILCSLTEFYVKLAVVFKALFFHCGTSSLFGTWEWCHYRILRRHMVFVSKELETFLIKMASKHRSFHTVIHIFIERVSFREIVY